MIDIQVPMRHWTRSQGLNTLLEEIRAQTKLIAPLESEKFIKGQKKRKVTYRTRTVASTD
jgi:hypothetical protein